MNIVKFIDLGLADYKQAWDFQENIFNETVRKKLFNRDNEIEKVAVDNHIIFCEHPHVYTLGKSGVEENLLLNENEMNEKNISFYKINRGGDITYHGPGQLVCYPILDLDQFITDIHIFMRNLEEAIIKTMAAWNIKAGRIAGLTGVWLDEGIIGKERKICAMGIRASRWVTMHGLALNVSPQLDFFQNIIPCGITDKQVTSMQHELGFAPAMNDVKNELKRNLAEVFGF